MNNTTETTIIKSTHKKYLIPAGVSIAIVLIAVITTLLLSNSNQGTTEDTDTNSNTSFPESEIVEELPVETESISFVNENQFRKTSIQSFESEFCTIHDDLKYPVNIDRYEYNLDQDSVITQFIDRTTSIGYAWVSRNASQNNYEPLAQSVLDSIDQIFAGDYDPSALINTQIDLLFSKNCGGNDFQPIAKVINIDYPGTDSALAFVSFGSNQSVSNKSWMPVSVGILFKKGGDYGYTLIPSYSYEFITNVNNLDQCEVNNAITDNECVFRVLNEDLNENKVNEIVQEWLEIFELE